MKLERLSPNKIKYSISFEELMGKGFFHEEMLEGSFIWDELFDEMLDEAGRQYELEASGTVSIEIFSLTSKELVLILTLDEEEPRAEGRSLESTLAEDNTGQRAFSFQSIEEVIALARRLRGPRAASDGGALYVYDNQYVMLFSDRISIGAIGLCEEYGSKCEETPAFIEEYGEKLIESNSIEILNRHFSRT